MFTPFGWLCNNSSGVFTIGGQALLPAVTLTAGRIAARVIAAGKKITF
jgi:hypothetical protein